MIFHIVLVLYILAIILDVTTTYFGIRYMGATEANWLFKHIAKRMPLNHFILTLLVIKLLGIIPMLYLSKENNLLTWIFTAVMLLYWYIPLGNVFKIQAVLSEQKPQRLHKL